MFRVASFGFLLMLSSAFGQTHFISLFIADLRDEFGLTDGGIGSLYSLATLASAACLAWLGRLIDHTDLRLYAACVIGGLAFAACAMAFSATLWQLGAAFFLLRLCGQGLSPHTGMTTTARLTVRRRGRALSLAGLGLAVGEALAAPTVAALLVFLTWREVWLGAALAQLVIVMAAAQLILAKLPHHPPALHDGGDGATSGVSVSWTRKQVLGDIRFWRAAPALFAPPFIITALLFHQNSLADFKGVAFGVWSSGLAAYAFAAVGASLWAGGLVDKFGAARVAKCCLAPLIVASLTPVLMDDLPLPFIYYALMGAAVGLSIPSVNALWAEVYGIAHLGAVRSLSQAMVVLFSAGGPVIYGLMLDAGMGWTFILLASAVWMSASAVLFVLTPMQNRPPPTPPPAVSP